MDRWLRWTVAWAVFGVVFGASFVVAGAATEPVAPEDSPALFGTEPSRPGDRGLYKTALVVVRGGQGEYFDMNARYAFERLDDRRMPASGGAVVPVASFVGEWRSEPFRLPLRDILAIPMLEMPNCFPQGGFDPMDEQDTERWAEEMEACGEQMEAAGEAFADQMEAWGEELATQMEQWSVALDREFHTVDAMGWHVTHHAGNATIAASYRDDAPIPGAVAVHQVPLGGSVEAADSIGPLVLTEPLALPGPCGWRTSLQDGPQDMWQPITVHGECPADMELGFARVRHEPGPIVMRVSGQDRFNGQDAVVFSMQESPDRLRLWFTQDTPYPVRVLTRTESVPEPVREALGRDYRAPAFYVLHELIEFEVGQAAVPLDAAVVPAWSASAGPAGPELGGFAHPWPVAQALADAADPVKAPTSCRAWRDWVSVNPDFVVRNAQMAWVETDDDPNDPMIDEAWTLVAQAGQSQQVVVVQRHTETVVQPPVADHAPGPWLAAWRATASLPTVAVSPAVEALSAVAGWPATSASLAPEAFPSGPGQEADPIRASTYACASADVDDVAPGPAGPFPDVAAAAARLQAFTGTVAAGYGFTHACLGSCQDGEARLTVGVSPVTPGGGDVVDLLTLGPDGGLRMHAASGDIYPPARFSDPQWDPAAGADPWGFRVAGSGAWTMPKPATAASLAAAGAAAGGLFLLWPALKAALAALPLFSRIRDEDLLEHPIRHQIHQMVNEEPGIHFQQMVRRIGKGRGTTEHHLRKLVAGGVVLEKAHRGFTCYFPKGRIDRNLMAAAPLLKSEGARQILHAVQQQPGSPALDVAQRLGMATSTVNYHVKKLADAGLLDARRDGRFMRLSVTGTGEQALGHFGGT